MLWLVVALFASGVLVRAFDLAAAACYTMPSPLTHVMSLRAESELCYSSAGSASAFWRWSGGHVAVRLRRHAALVVVQAWMRVRAVMYRRANVVSSLWFSGSVGMLRFVAHSSGVAQRLGSASAVVRSRRSLRVRTDRSRSAGTCLGRLGLFVPPHRLVSFGYTCCVRSAPGAARCGARFLARRHAFGRRMGGPNKARESDLGTGRYDRGADRG